MSLFDCIDTAVQGGEMDPARGAEAQRLFNELRGDYAGRIGEDAANAQAAADVKQIMGARAGRKRRLTMLRLSAARRNTQHMMGHRTLRGAQNPADALRIFINGDEASAIPGIVPVAKSLKGFYHAELDRVLQSFGRNIFGQVRNKAKLSNMVRELFGESSDDAVAGELAQAARHVLDRARRDFNAVGGDVGKLDNYGLPMHHNGRTIEAEGFDAWRDFIWNKLDWNRITDYETDRPFAVSGSLPPRGGRADEFLNEIYRTITTDGWAKREASFMDRGLSVANSRSASRVLHFKGGDAWLEYNGRFGSEDPFTTIVTALDGYARDTAAMKVLGPNPRAGLTYLSQIAEKTAQETPWRASRGSAVNEARKAARKAQAMLDLHSGAAQAPVDEYLGNFLAGTRGVLVAAQLGSAAVSAVTDIGFQSVAGRKIGLDPGGIIGKMLKEFGSATADAGRKGLNALGADLELRRNSSRAIRMGLIADQLSNVGAAQARYMGEAFTPETAARLADFVMRASGLSKWTEAGRHAFQLEFMGFLADNADLSWRDMDAPLRKVLERKGFSADEWDVIRSTDLHDEDGATFLVPVELRNRADIPAGQADDLALRLMSVIHEQTEFAVPSASLEGQAVFLDQTRPGTLIGELARSGVMYKSFGMSVLYNQIRRTMTYDGPWSRVGYAGGMIALTTVMGAVSLQMKEILKGRDPRPMDTPEFLGAALLQGGGLGIFGDFLSSESNRFGGGIEGTLAGPVFGVAGDALSLGITAARAPFGGPGNLGREASNFLRYNTPITGIWYWKSAFQRGLFDNLQRMLDPDAERAWRGAERRRINEYGNPAWWGPGELLPSRAPDMSTALSR